MTYTPSTEDIRDEWVYRYAPGGEGSREWDAVTGEFDRWFEGELRKAKAQALREAADDLDPVPEDNTGFAMNWLRDRANRIEAGDE